MTAPAPDARKTTIQQLLVLLREGKAAAIRARKSDLQREFMVARRMLEQTYRDFEPEDMPVDLVRLQRDLVITRDRLVAEAQDELESGFAIARDVIVSVADQHAAFYHAPPKARAAGPGLPAGVPERIAKVLTPTAMAGIATVVLQPAGGATLVQVCEQTGMTSAPMHMAAKRFLAWLRDRGHVKTQGPSGKGKRYVAKPSLKTLVERLMGDEEPARTCGNAGEGATEGEAEPKHPDPFIAPASATCAGAPDEREAQNHRVR